MKLGKRQREKGKAINIRNMKSSIQILVIISFLPVNCSNSKEGIEKERSKLVIEKYDNGQLQYIGYKVGDKKVGEWREFRRGKLFTISNYHQGTKHGKEISYESCTGKILEKGQYEMGKHVGLWYWYSNGELVSIMEYKNDSSELIYHNPKFQNEGDLPPPPPENYDCYED